MPMIARRRTARRLPRRYHLGVRFQNGGRQLDIHHLVVPTSGRSAHHFTLGRGRRSLHLTIRQKSGHLVATVRSRPQSREVTTFTLSLQNPWHGWRQLHLTRDGAHPGLTGEARVIFAPVVFPFRPA